MKRMIIAVTVEDGADKHDIATQAGAIGTDATAWEWADFLADIKDGVITGHSDATAEEPWCNHDAVAVVDGVCECGVRVEFDHDAVPDDDPEPGDRCKVCGEDITWMGPSPTTDWLHVNDLRNS
jgi:hypothetical protein